MEQGTQHPSKGWPYWDEKGASMAPLSSNPDHDFSAGYGTKELELGDWRSEPPLPLKELFDDPVARKRVGKLISEAVQRGL